MSILPGIRALVFLEDALSAPAQQQFLQVFVRQEQDVPVLNGESDIKAALDSHAGGGNLCFHGVVPGAQLPPAAVFVLGLVQLLHNVAFHEFRTQFG